jgi:hypothetical protein
MIQKRGTTLRDGYSNFKFLQGIDPFITTDPPAHAGDEIDIKGFDTVTLIVNVGEVASAGAMAADDFHQLKLEHYNSDAGAWSEVYPSQMIHSVVGAAATVAGASVLNSGIFQSIASSTDGSTVYYVGYKGPHRTVRLYISGELTPSVMLVGATWKLGLPSDWPVTEPIGD